MSAPEGGLVTWLINGEWSPLLVLAFIFFVLLAGLGLTRLRQRLRGVPPCRHRSTTRSETMGMKVVTCDHCREEVRESRGDWWLVASVFVLTGALIWWTATA